MKQKKTIILAIMVIIVIAIIAFVAFVAAQKNSPQNKVEKLEQSIESNKEDSGYNECVKKVDEKINKLQYCVKSKLEEQGYTDGLNCIDQYENPICQNTERYNAEIYAGNDCTPMADQVTNLSKLDCIKLLENK